MMTKDLDCLVLLDMYMEYEGARQTVESKSNVVSLDASTATLQEVLDWLHLQNTQIACHDDLAKCLSKRQCEYHTRTHVDVYRKKVVCTVHKFPGLPVCKTDDETRSADE